MRQRDQYRHSPRFGERLRTSADNVRKESPEHPLDRLIRRGPNCWQTWPDFVEFWIAQTLLRGNGLVEIVSDKRGQVVELIPYPWDWVTVQLLPSGRVAYDVCEMYGYLGEKGRRKRLLSGEVLHLRDRTDEGIVGRSRLQRGAAVVSAASGLYEFAGSLYQNGIYPSGILMPEMNTLSNEQTGMIREALNRALQGPKKAGAAMILPLTMKWPIPCHVTRRRRIVGIPPFHHRRDLSSVSGSAADCAGS